MGWGQGEDHICKGPLGLAGSANQGIRLNYSATLLARSEPPSPPAPECRPRGEAASPSGSSRPVQWGWRYLRDPLSAAYAFQSAWLVGKGATKLLSPPPPPRPSTLPGKPKVTLLLLLFALPFPGLGLPVWTCSGSLAEPRRQLPALRDPACLSPRLSQEGSNLESRLGVLPLHSTLSEQAGGLGSRFPPGPRALAES